MDLHVVEGQIRQQFERLHMPDQAYGCYRGGPDKEPDLYATLDVVLARAIMGEDFHQTLSAQQRQSWCDYINSYATTDGSYQRFTGHSALHANGMVIGALGPLGGHQAHPVSLYDEFKGVDQIADWLDTIDWSKQWGASHLFWGGMHCYAVSQECTHEWKQAVFGWLDAQLDPHTGWWRRGTPHSDRHQPLGGSVHIIPMYQHLDHAFPYPQQLTDSCLALQLDNGCWLDEHPTRLSYLELDALYVFAFCRTTCPDYRRDAVDAAVKRFGDFFETFWTAHGLQYLQQQHPHRILGATGIFGLLQQLDPRRWIHAVQWSDIFSDPRLYMTDSVSASPHLK